MKPSLGRVVLFRMFDSNGVIEHPAIINRVWSDVCVNLAILPDCGGIVNKTSVMYSDDILDESKNHSWRWPPRVE
jgi:hypothetical protein